MIQVNKNNKVNTLKISELMTKQVHQIDINDELIKVRNIMDKYEINHLPVMDNGKLVGMISSNDIKKVQYLCEFIGERLEESTIFKSLSIEELMEENVQSLTSNATIAEAIQIFSNASFQSLPVMENDELVGIVTTKDIFGSFLINK